jgi:glycosyltransferase involved in cell wall biosynthesis
MVGRGPEIFKPSDKQLVRTTLGIPSDKKVIFFGATSYEQKRKGLSYLLKAFQHLKKLLCSSNRQNDLLLVIAGNHNKGLFEQLPFEYKYIGMLNSDKELASAYQASDIFVCSSVEDSGPLMINESIMCGTPVVSFEMGGALDLVHTHKTGYRAMLKDSEDLARGIYRLLSLSDTEYAQTGANCRELGLKLCSPSVQLRGLQRIFNLAITEIQSKPLTNLSN